MSNIGNKQIAPTDADAPVASCYGCWFSPENFQFDLTDIVILLSVLVTAAIFFYHRHVTQRNLFDAAYHHVVMTEEALMELRDGIEALPEKIRGNPNYMPHYIVPRDDNLTYEQIIGLMRWLNDDEEKAILRYFHAQATLHEAAVSFEKEIVRDPERRINLAKVLVKHCRETLKHAETAKRFLGKKRKRRARATTAKSQATG